MPCIVNWDAKSMPPVDTVQLSPDGCIINWDKAAATTAAAKGGCIVNWDAQTDISAEMRNAQGGCIIDWDAKSDLVRLSKATPGAEDVCIINWLGVKAADLAAAAQGGCIINW